MRRDTTIFDKPSPRVGAIGLALLIALIAFIIIPDPNNYHYYPWPHKLIHIYCNCALVWIYWDDAENGHCNLGHESRAFMVNLHMLAKYPVYGIILNIIHIQRL